MRTVDEEGEQATTASMKKAAWYNDTSESPGQLIYIFLIFSSSTTRRLAPIINTITVSTFVACREGSSVSTSTAELYRLTEDAAL